MNKKLIIIFSLIFLLLMITNVSASDTNTTEDDTCSMMDYSAEVTGVDDNVSVLSTAQGTFTELQSLINGGSDAVILDKDYTFDSDVDGNLKSGIKISKSIMINGNGHTINADNCGRIFNITGNNVILNDLIITNACINNSLDYRYTNNHNTSISADNGAGIIWVGLNGILNNTIISNNNIYVDATFMYSEDVNTTYLLASGAGVYWTGDNGIIENTCFINNHIKVNTIIKDNFYTISDNIINRNVGYGIALYLSGCNAVVRKSEFKNNTINSKYSYTDSAGTDLNYIFATNVVVNNNICNGRSVYWAGSYGSIDYTEFSDNKGGIEVNADGVIISNSLFSNNYYPDSSPVIIDGCANSVVNCSFINNSAFNSNGVLSIFGSDGFIKGCNFTDNYAHNYGALNVECKNLLLVDCNFTGNVADNNGGAVGWCGSSGVIRGCAFEYNSANNYGGVVYSNVDGLTIDSVFISNNNAFLGNGVYSTGGVLFKSYNNIKDSIVVSSYLLDYDFYIGPDGSGSGKSVDDLASWDYAIANIASGHSIFLTSGIYTNINGGTVGKKVNIIGQNGVVIDLTGSVNAFTIDCDDVVVKDIIFKNSHGSALIWSGNDGFIVNCTFINNTAVCGGAVYYNGCGLIIVNSTFSDNFASDFNDVYDQNMDVILVNNVFSGDYISVSDKVLLNFSNAFVKITPSGSVNIKVKLNAKIVNSFSVSNVNSNIPISFVNVKSGMYVLDVLFSCDNNTYVNGERKYIEIAEPNVIYVSNNGHGSGSKDDPTNMNNALNIVKSGDTIILVDGVFNTFNGISVNVADISIKGSGNTVIDLENNKVGFNILAANVNLSNIIFKNGYGRNGAAVSWSGSYGLVDHCTFINNIGPWGGAIIAGGSHVKIYNSIFINNSANSREGGAIRCNSYRGVIYNCTFINNTATINGGAISFHAQGKLSSILNCTFINNNGLTGSGGAVSSESNAYSITVKGSFFQNNHALNLYDLYLNKPDSCRIIGNKFYNDDYLNMSLVFDANISSCFTGPYNVKLSSFNENIMGSIIIDNVDMGVFHVSSNSLSNSIMYLPSNLSIGEHSIMLLFNNSSVFNQYFQTSTQSFNVYSPSIFYVSPTGEGYGLDISTPCSFSYALDNAAVGSIIILLNGTYTGIKDYIIGTDNLIIKGSGNTVFDGEGVNNFFRVNGKYISMSNILFKNGIQTGSVLGAGPIHWYGQYGVIDNCTFKSSRGKFGVFINNDYVKIVNSVFIDNTATNAGAALRIYVNKNVLIDNCTFINNTGRYGGAISIGSSSNTTIINCRFINNAASSSGSGAIQSSGTLFVYSSNFTNNTAKSGYNMDITSSALTMEDNIFNGYYLSQDGNNIVFPLSIVENVSIKVIIDNEEKMDLIFSPSDTLKFSIPNDLTGGAHTVCIEVSALNNEYHIQPFIFTSESKIYYVSVSGGGSGLDISTPCSFSYALDNVPVGGTIILLNGTYTGIKDYIIETDNLVITGSGNTVFDGEGVNNFFLVKGNNVIVRNILFKNGAQVNGVLDAGSIDWNGEYGVIDNCTFVNCRNRFGVVYIHKQLFNFTNSVFINNFASSDGGALRIVTNNVLIDNCTFINNAARGTGGAISVAGLNIIVKNSRFINNSVHGNGGAIHSISGSLFVYSSNFTDNYASVLNDIYSKDSLTLNDNIFTGTYSSLSGNVSVSEDFIKATLMEDGLQLQITANDYVFDTIIHGCYNCDEYKFYLNLTPGFYNLNMSFNSVGINKYINRLSNFTLMQSIFYVNVTGTGSGLNSSDPCSLSYALDNVPVGGTIILLNGTYTGIKDYIIETNNLVITGSGNTVFDGEGVNNYFLVNGNNVTMSNISFKNGVRVEGILGAGVVQFAGLYGVVDNCSFVNCSTVWGALFSSGKYFSVCNSIFINNAASRSGAGGAVRVIRDNALIDNCTFINNKGFRNKGFVLSDSSNSVRVVRSYFESNDLKHVSTNADKGMVVSYSCFVNSSVSGDYVDESYNWYGSNNPDVSVPYLKINLRYSSDMVLGEVNPVYIYFTRNDTNEIVSPDLLPAIAIRYVVNCGEFNCVINNTHYPIYITPVVVDRINISLMINDEVLYIVSNVTGAYSFSDLQVLIDSFIAGKMLGDVGDDVLRLNHDYSYVDGDNVIMIDKPIVIDGNGHVVSAKGFCGVFNVSAADVVLNNIVFENSSVCAIECVGSNIGMCNVSMNNIGGTGVRVFGGYCDVVNLTVVGGNGSVLVVHGDGSCVSGVVLLNHFGDGLYLNGSGCCVDNVSVVGGIGVGVCVVGDGAMVRGVNLSMADGVGVNASGKGVEVCNVNVRGGGCVGVVLSGFGAGVFDVVLSDFDGVGVESDGIGCVVGDIVVVGGDGCAVVVGGVGSSVSNLSACDFNGSVVVVGGDDSVVGGVDLYNIGGFGVRIDCDGVDVDDFVVRDCLNLTVFNLLGDNICLNNITLLNISGLDYYLYFSGDNISVINSLFINNSCDNLFCFNCSHDLLIKNSIITNKDKCLFILLT